MPPELSPRDKQAIVQSLWTSWNNGGAALEQFPRTIKSILDTGAWEDRDVDGKQMHNSTFREFIISPPLKGCGWGKQIDAIQELLDLRAPEIAGKFRKAMGGGQGARNDLIEPTDNVSKSGRNEGHGNSKAYTLDRLEREHGDLFDRVISGELSANAAAKLAGFRKEPSAYKQVLKFWPQLTESQREEFRSMP